MNIQRVARVLSIAIAIILATGGVSHAGVVGSVFNAAGEVVALPFRILGGIF